jgi:hypothetical protein
MRIDTWPALQPTAFARASAGTSIASAVAPSVKRAEKRVRVANTDPPANVRDTVRPVVLGSERVADAEGLADTGPGLRR